MENQTISLQIPCPLHPFETIQRVAMDKNVEHHLYCLECVVQQKPRPGGAPQTLRPIAELIDTASSFYNKKRKNIKLGEQIPNEIADILSDQNEKLEVLTKHIEEEKKRVSKIFDSLCEEFLTIIEEKKTQVLYKLDQQIFDLRFLNISFEKQLKKTYPTLEDIPTLYPTREDLIAKLAKITNAPQLTALVKSIKDDLNETTPSLKSNDREYEIKRISAIHKMNHQLLEATKRGLSYQREDFDLQKLKQGLREKVSDLIPTGSTVESTFLKAQDFDLIKSWLPKGLVWSPKLLYKGSRDGMDGPTFHRFCDGKENTITVIKAAFQDQDAHTVSIFGGYLDKPWHSNGGFIQSTESFLFSLTKNIKCSLTNEKAKYAASGHANQGPCFGGGYDIGLWAEGGSSFVYPHSYQKSNQLVEGFVFSRGQVFMDVLEVEVYSVN